MQVRRVVSIRWWSGHSDWARQTVGRSQWWALEREEKERISTPVHWYSRDKTQHKFNERYGLNKFTPCWT